MTQYFLMTDRLAIRQATAEDANYIHSLWTSPDVMKYVGYPRGLLIDVEEVQSQIERDGGGEFGSRLIVEDRRTGERIGQTKLGIPDENGICEPDIKLHPDHWGVGYGSELWTALIDYAFTHPETQIVRGTPNRSNIASVRMQRGAGMETIAEGEFSNEGSPHPGAVPVPHYVLHISREQWMEKARRMQEETTS